MKVAICYTGLIRTLNKVYNTHIENIFNVLKQHNIDYDIYVHTWTGKNILSNNLDDLNLITPTYIQIDNQDATFLESLCFEDFFYKNIYELYGNTHHGEWVPEILLNHLCSLESRKRVSNMVLNSNKNYDWILFLRCDLLIKYPINIECIINNIDNNTVIIPNYYHFEGYNDSVIICHPNIVKYYSHRIDNAKEYRKYNGRIVSEKFLKYSLDTSPLNIRLCSFIETEIVRLNGDICTMINY